jgi:PhnB protein
MPKAKHHIPEGLHTVTPQLVVSDGRRLLDFIQAAFNGEGVHTMPNPDGKGVMHGHIRIGDVAVFVSDASGFAKPTTSNLFLYVPDVDRAIAQAIKAGAKVLAPASDMFWGDRWGMVEDPFGNVWQIATHVEDVPPEEFAQRMKAGSPPSR